MTSDAGWAKSYVIQAPSIISDYRVDIIQLTDEERVMKLEVEEHGYTAYASVAGFKLKLARRSGRYLYLYYLPSSLLVFISWLSFLMPHNNVDGRVGLLITSLLVLVNIFNAVIESTPREAEGLTAITIWILGMMFFVFISFIGYLVILLRLKIIQSKRYNEVSEGVRRDPVRENSLIDFMMLAASCVLFCLFVTIYSLTI